MAGDRGTVDRAARGPRHSIFCRTERHRIIDCLFTLEDDPHETTNPIGLNPDRARCRDVAERMERLLLGCTEDIGHPPIDHVSRKPAVVGAAPGALPAL